MEAKKVHSGNVFAEARRLAWTPNEAFTLLAIAVSAVKAGKVGEVSPASIGEWSRQIGAWPSETRSAFRALIKDGVLEVLSIEVDGKPRKGHRLTTKTDRLVELIREELVGG